MPVGEDTVRSRYYKEGRTHPNRFSKKKTGFEGNNWPSTRTFYSDISLEVVKISKKLIYYCYLSGLKANASTTPHILESVSRDLGHYVSNYTISGLLNERWGPRHNPKEQTLVAVLHLIGWLERKCKKLGIYKPFKFRLHPVDKHKQEQDNETIENNQASIARSRRKNRQEESQSGGVEFRNGRLLEVREERGVREIVGLRGFYRS